MNTNNQQPTTNNIKKGILLVNLGSPKSTKVEDVKEYLDEFLMDEQKISDILTEYVSPAVENDGGKISLLE